MFSSEFHLHLIRTRAGVQESDGKSKRDEFLSTDPSSDRKGRATSTGPASVGTDDRLHDRLGPMCPF